MVLGFKILILCLISSPKKKIERLLATFFKKNGWWGLTCRPLGLMFYYIFIPYRVISLFLLIRRETMYPRLHCQRLGCVGYSSYILVTSSANKAIFYFHFSFDVKRWVGYGRYTQEWVGMMKMCPRRSVASSKLELMFPFRQLSNFSDMN